MVFGFSDVAITELGMNSALLQLWAGVEENRSQGQQAHEPGFLFGERNHVFLGSDTRAYVFFCQ